MPPPAGAAAAAAAEAGCVALVAAFLAFCCVPPLHARARALLRPRAVAYVEDGLAAVAAAQRRFERPWLTRLANASGATVSVAFYGTFLPTLIWLGLPDLGWRLVVLMALALYVGNAMKDLVCSPRPARARGGAARRVRVLAPADGEAGRNAAEFGLPSSHTLNSLCLNGYAARYCVAEGLAPRGAGAALFAGVAAWVAWIAFTRVYLGLHTPVDIVAGAAAGLATLACFSAVEGAVKLWVAAAPALPLQVAAACLLLLRLHPRPAEHTPSYEFTTSFLGVLLGVLGGVRAAPAAFYPPVQLERLRAAGGAAWAARRLALGFAVVLAAKRGAWACAHAALPPLYRAAPPRLRRLWQPPLHDLAAGAAAAGGDPRLAGLPRNARGTPWDVVVTARFFSYAGLGFAVCWAAPAAFAALGW